MGSHEPFAWTGLKPQISQSQPPKIGLQAWATGTEPKGFFFVFLWV
jgi:hypothetical protein